MHGPELSGVTVLASGLEFPEGPVVTDDGGLLVVEIRRQTLTRIAQGEASVVARVPGGPNGAAHGPDGQIYICNNGGFSWSPHNGVYVPGNQPDDYRGGSIDVVDPRTGAVRTLYRDCDGRPLRGPNDLVFDGHGGFYFTDLGKRRAREADIGAVYWARADGSQIREVTFPLDRPNGIGLSPDGWTLYVAETPTSRLWAFDIEEPGVIRPANGAYRGERGRPIAGLPGYQLFDSLAVEAGGNICVATLVSGVISVFAPDGGLVEQVPAGDSHVTNICFGGPDMKTAYLTRSGIGDVVAMAWPRPGLKLAY